MKKNAAKASNGLDMDDPAIALFVFIVDFCLVGDGTGTKYL